ncbi:L-alanine exporter AlaE [Falsirhodobacter xinxiangensis]|uniref:L-alanine exporter AlaE n=1 Tax=Falsirhodobacter xinxiangensis TaxID=2530049 RepID=UPI0010AA9CD8|nr:L-alanine exporter AlaE [Rhodobacter xinxiangensis]
MADTTRRSGAIWGYVADTLALILFFTTTGIINERFIAGMTWEQVFHARLIGGVLMIPVGRPYGMWRDWKMAHASEEMRLAYCDASLQIRCLLRRRHRERQGEGGCK